MVIGLLMITAIPVVTGTAQAVSAQKNRDQQQKDERRMKKFHIDIRCTGDSKQAKELDGKRVVLKADRLWLGPAAVVQKGDYGYVAESFYIEYPDTERAPAPMGLVSQVWDDPPLLNWIYVDKNTMEVKYGNKSASITHNIGPWDWSEDEVQIVFDDMDVAFINAFYAVERLPGKWQLFFDMKGDQLAGYLPTKMTKIQVELHRNLIVAAGEAETA
ncbi:hypothetical protein LTR70_003158 [Exophiala xenobiotica]|uniref:Uncharacterized protein n=1 Tax=Lithohypha guttulata TaxID=1690604 RepID=A0ABR0KGV4_9EURO|nr:hypothetical protein LTR24_002803 [Lithohypha guttulata]KAK5323670.1 hypothetical protein LTR70_003158 [Exophiala xenobiotica]